MKTIKFFNSLFTALLFICLLGVALTIAGLPAAAVYTTLLSIVLLATIVAAFTKSEGSVLSATIFKEVWTGEIIKRVGIMESFAWVAAITKDYSRYVSTLNEEAQVIHLASFPIQPDVLIDNTTYPIPTQALTTSDVVISLNKFQTKVTAVTDDVLYANTTNPMALHAEAHTSSIFENKLSLGAWNICPTANSAAMPVMAATGADDGTGRKKLTFADVLSYKRLLDNAVPKIPSTPGSRILVLSQDHENDLASADQTFKERFYDWATGKPYNALGFTFYSSEANPYYNTTTLTKQSFGVTVTGAMRRATMFFSTRITGKATGGTIPYLTPKTAETQQNSMAVRHYHLITRLMNEGVGAIVSPDA